MTSDLYSVSLFPVFNNELYIKQTLTSVFEQIDNDVEVIIVNDGSTDNSAALIQKAIDDVSRHWRPSLY
ncbi:glycosyltransferase family 2 protein [Klebsiella pneumoniae subsp. pneumoniae]|nr:glycosyltransferase family 2 protein [Klebsiella pneumoniae subsp. pneumoniae]